MVSRTTDGAARERLIVGFSSVAFGLGTILAARRMVSVFLSVDGAHAITDARGFLGLAPRPPYYLPGFPALLVPLDRVGVDPRINVAIVLAVLCGALFAALYWLVRDAVSARAAFFGAIVGAASTSLGELLGWQGGATLLALVGITASFAAFSRWARSGQWYYALLVGVCFTVALASHPFVVAFGAFVLLGMWLDRLVRERSLTIRSFGPLGLAGMLVAMSVPLIGALALAGSYLAIDAPAGSSLRIPDPTTPLAVFEWVTRESPALAILTGALMLAAVMKRGTGRLIALLTVLTFVLVPAVLAGDASYQTRVVYVLAPALTLGAVALWSEAEGLVRSARFSSGSRAAAVFAACAPLAFGVWAASLSFPQRLLVAIPYYSSLSSEDYALIRSLGDDPGAVATSWMANRYWDGLLNGWYVEGIANRAALGPTDPALTTRGIERDRSVGAWRLFSGAFGIENGSLQLAFGPAGWRADPAIAGRIEGSYLPLVFIADASNDYGEGDDIGPALAWSLEEGGATGVRRDTSGRPLFQISTQLDGNRTQVHWIRDSAAPPTPWTIWIWPAYGLPWRDVSAEATKVVVHPYSYQAYRDIAGFDAANPRIELEVAGGATLAYYAVDPRYRIPAIAIRVPASSDLDLSVAIVGAMADGETVTYDERDLIAQFDVGASLVWRNTGWADRFSSSPCFTLSQSDINLVAFDVTPACRAAP